MKEVVYTIGALALIICMSGCELQKQTRYANVAKVVDWAIPILTTSDANVVERPPDILSQKELTLTWAIPILTTSDETPAERKAGNIKISAAPVLFRKDISHKIQKHLRGSKAGKTGVKRFEYYDGEDVPIAIVTPERLIFTVTVHNQMKRILRLAGSVISINVEGKKIALSEGDYKGFLDGIVLSRDEAQYEIKGPSIDSLPIKDTIAIGLFIHDVVIETDAAGNPTKRENFQWYYTCKLNKVTERHKTEVERQVVDTMPYACDECDGRGMMKCRRCGGDGLVELGILVGECSVCNKTGEIYCSVCSGTGRK